MLIQQTPEETVHSATLQKRCELQDIYLLSCRINRESDVESVTEPLTIALAFKSLANLVDGGFQATTDYSLMAQDSSPTPRTIFQIDCVFRVLYEFKGEIPKEEELLSFSKANAIFNCWPYAREFFQTTATRMAVRVPPLPYLRIITVRPALQPDQMQAPEAPRVPKDVKKTQAKRVKSAAEHKQTGSD